MTRITITRTINAPIDKVFNTVADIRNFSEVVPCIVDVEYLTKNRVGVGARFIETRVMGKRKASMEFEVTEYVENDHFRIKTEAGGTVWDSLFTFEEKDGAVVLTMAMDAITKNFFMDLMNKMMKKMIQKGTEEDFDIVKAHCEQ